MRIYSPQLGLSNESNLGGEVHDHFLVQSLANLGNKILVTLPKNKKFQKHINLEVDYLPINHFPAFLFNLMVTPYIFSKKNKFDVLLIHNPYYVGLGGLVFKFFNPKIPIATTHNLIEKGKFFNFINSITVKRYDAIFAVSNDVKNWLIETYHVDQNKIHVTYNGIDPQFKHSSKNKDLIKLYRLEGKFILLYVGMLIKRKNPLLLLKVFKRLSSKDKKVTLIICGKGPLKNSLKEYIVNNNLKNIILINEVYGTDKVNLFNLCDVFVFPSKNEGFGLAVAEAMACGKPPVVSNNSALKELVSDGVNGLLVNGDGINQWIDKIQSLKTDHYLYRKLSQGALKKSKGFNWNLVAEKYQNVLKKIINA